MTDLHWWQTAVFYQIYPRSFADGNGDGLGDLPGIVNRLDYLQDLGVDALWLSPHYPSPQFDVGYDIADYTGVDPEYGTLADFKSFLDGAHRRGMRVILDWVLNHTSDQHAWFRESRSSRDNPKRDWYVWRPGSNGAGESKAFAGEARSASLSPLSGAPTLPNNWLSHFGGSAWEYDPPTGEYYYHYFFKQQPDLNWRNPAVQQAMAEAARFWLDLGVDGFRVDAIGTVYEDPALTDHTFPRPQSELFRAHFTARTAAEHQAVTNAYRHLYQYQTDLPEVHDLMKALRALTDQYGASPRMLVGETEEMAYYGDGDEFHLVFNFPLMRTDRLTPAWIRANQTERLATLPRGAWPCNTLGNHDSARVLSRYGDGRNDEALARLALALVLTLRGTPFLYNGEEIGMADWLLSDLAQFRDNVGVWQYGLLTRELGLPPAEAIRIAARQSRDKCRTPMQWANAPNAGFSPAGVQTWLPVHPNYARGVNVAEQDRDPNSMLNFYRRMLRLRREMPALISGDYMPVAESATDYFAFTRRAESGPACVVVLNFSDRTHNIPLDLAARAVRCRLATYRADETTQTPAELKIAPFGIFIGELVA